MESDFFGHLIHLFGVVALTVVEYVPCLQFVHEILPMIDLYLPATHVVHVLPFGPCDPELHLQSFMLVLPVSEIDFSGHG